MEIGKLDKQCGFCLVEDYCRTESGYAICSDVRLKHVTEKEFIKLVEGAPYCKPDTCIGCKHDYCEGNEHHNGECEHAFDEKELSTKGFVNYVCKELFGCDTCHGNDILCNWHLDVQVCGKLQDFNESVFKRNRMIINGYEVKVTMAVFDGCHKIFIPVEGQEEAFVDDMIGEGWDFVEDFYKVNSANDLMNMYLDSCSLRFIQQIDLSGEKSVFINIIPQCAFYDDEDVFDRDLARQAFADLE